MKNKLTTLLKSLFAAPPPPVDAETITFRSYPATAENDAIVARLCNAFESRKRGMQGKVRVVREKQIEVVRF